MKQKRKVKSQNFTESGANKLLASLLILLGGILCFGAMSLITTPKVSGQLSVLSYTGLDNKNDVVYHMYFLDKYNLDKVVNEMYMKEDNRKPNFHISGNSVVLQNYIITSEQLKEDVNVVGTGKSSNVLGGEDNTVNSSNITIIAGKGNVVNSGNDNATVMGGVDGVVSIGGGGIPLVFVGGSGNKIGENQNGNVIIGGSNNEILNDKSNSHILGGENNKVYTNDAIVVGSDIQNAAEDSFVFSSKRDEDGFWPQDPHAFYLNVEKGVGLNMEAENDGISSNGIVGIGEMREEICTQDNVGLQGVLSGCLVGCAKDGQLELLDTSERCMKQFFGEDPDYPIPDNPGYCYTGNVNIDNSHPCNPGEWVGYANVSFEVSLIDAIDEQQCPTVGDNQCTYQCNDGWHLIDGKCYKDCELPWPGEPIKHKETVKAWRDPLPECGGTCGGDNEKLLICNDGNLDEGEFIYGECNLQNYEVDTSEYPLTPDQIDLDRGNYSSDKDLLANGNYQCNDGPIHYRLDSCKSNYTRVGDKCFAKCSYNGDYISHMQSATWYASSSECREDGKTECSSKADRLCYDGNWGGPDYEYTSCSLTDEICENQCDPGDPDCETPNPPVIDGQCGTKAYECVKGEADEKNNNGNTWTWICKGSGGGRDADCEKTTTYSCNGSYPTGATPSSQTPVANMDWQCATNTNNACSYTCPKGQECDGTSGCKNTVYKCSPGTYLKKGTTSCTQCPCGSYCRGSNFTYNALKDQGIEACGDGKWSKAGSDTCSNISCGYYGSSACSPTPNQCGDGTYSSTGSSQCSTCTSGQPDANKCACIGGVNCTGTAPGDNTRYSNANPSSSKAWTYISNTNAVLNACEWTCKDEYYERDGNKCYGQTLECGGSEPPVNADRSEDTYTYNGSLKNWESTTYLLVNGNWPCEWKCKSGRTGSDCSTPDDKIHCDAGTYLKANKTSCSDCEAGYYCPGGDFYKKNEDQGKNDCPCGSYCVAKSSEATSCGAGTYSSARSSQCSSCPSGQKPSSDQCSCVDDSGGSIHCDAGTYLKANSTSCSDCEAGYYCPGGNFYKKNIIQGREDCPCGSYCVAKSSEATACGDGKWSDANSSSCSKISCGYYGSSECSATPSSKKCASNKYSEAGSSQCSSCPSGSPASDQCSCVSDPKSCTGTEYTYNGCSYTIPNIGNGQSTTVNTSTSGYTGSVKATCTSGKFTYTSQSCTELSKKCPKKGGCGTGDVGDTCTTYLVDEYMGTYGCPSVAKLSTCINGEWDEDPFDYTSCTTYCDSSGGCGTGNVGDKCETYTESESDNCEDKKVKSTCSSNGAWSPHPGAWTKCETKQCKQDETVQSNGCFIEKEGDNGCGGTYKYYEGMGVGWVATDPGGCRYTQSSAAPRTSTCYKPMDTTCNRGYYWISCSCVSCSNRYSTSNGWYSGTNKPNGCYNADQTVDCGGVTFTHYTLNTGASCNGYWNTNSCTCNACESGIAGYSMNVTNCGGYTCNGGEVKMTCKRGNQCCACYCSNATCEHYGLDSECTASCTSGKRTTCSGPYTIPNGKTCYIKTTVSDTSCGGGSACFIAGTQVKMADGSMKNIEDVEVGDYLKGETSINKVEALYRPLLGRQGLFSINGGNNFVTAEHPFKTTEGWKSLDPQASMKVMSGYVGSLKVGDVLVTENGYEEVTSLVGMSASENTQLYNFRVDGDDTYFANGYLVHNKGCFLAGTQVYMADGTTKNIEDIEVGEMVLTYNTETKQNEYNKVLKKYVHENNTDKLYELTINGNVLKVTMAHRFYVVLDENDEYKCPYNWVAAAKLKVGYDLLMYDGSIVTIEDKIGYPYYGTVYNLLVENNNNYYVAEGYLVHNGIGLEGTPGVQVYNDNGDPAGGGSNNGDNKPGANNKQLMDTGG